MHENLCKLKSSYSAFVFVLFQIIHIDLESSEGAIYFIHYAGWNNRCAECPLKIDEGTNLLTNKYGNDEFNEQFNCKANE